MKINWSDRMQDAPAGKYRLEALTPEEAERIRKKTMKKIMQTETLPRRRVARPARLALIAAAITALLCGTAFAAYQLDWFGFRTVFGENAAVLDAYTKSYDENSDAALTLPGYTEEEQAMIADGTMQVPSQAELAEQGAAASTEDFTFTLESMVVSKDALLALMRIEAKNDTSAARLTALETATGYERELENLPLVLAENNAASGREKELANGGMSMELLQLGGSTAYVLLTNNGGRFAVGDKILFHELSANVDLFEVPVAELMEAERTIALDTAAYAQKDYAWQTMTVTPMALILEGSYTRTPDNMTPDITITLTDGTTFALAGPSNGYADAPYGSYGSSGHAGTSSGTEAGTMKDSWMLSQLLRLEEIRCISVDGIEYAIGEG